MHPTQLLAQLALWTSTAYAFYPFIPSWMEEKEKARSREDKRWLSGQDAKGIRMPLKQRAGQVLLIA